MHLFSALTARTAIVFSVIVVFPVLAMPPVNRRVNALLRGKSPPPRERADDAAPPAVPTRTRPEAGAAGETTAAAETDAAHGIVEQLGEPPSSPPPRAASPVVPADLAESTEHAAARNEARAQRPVSPTVERALQDADRTAEIQERLKALGASYMVLARLPEGVYRFHCRVDLQPHAVYARVFEATEATPREAMERVLEQVRQWRQGRVGETREGPPAASEERPKS